MVFWDSKFFMAEAPQPLDLRAAARGNADAFGTEFLEATSENGLCFEGWKHGQTV